ncbi:MAG: hypothetical protein AAF958_08485 [Planctomycetota bacterium]
MARSKSTANLPDTADAQEAIPTRLRKHLRRLGLRDLAAYEAWCRRRGLDFNPSKSRRLLDREIDRYRSEKQAANRPAPKPRSPKRHLANVFRHQVQADALGQPAVGAAFALSTRRWPHFSQASDVWEGFARLVEILQSCQTRFLQSANLNEGLVDGRGVSYLESLLWLYEKREHWLRDVTAWRPRTRNPRRQFQSLLRHLLDRHQEVPLFLDACWAPMTDNSNQQTDWFSRNAVAIQDWYLRIGRGHGAACLAEDFPHLNRRMRSQFLRAPDSLTISQAIRWAEARGMGADDRLTAEIVASRLGEHLGAPEFWSTVMAWFIQHPQIPKSQIGPLIDYLHHQRFVQSPVWDPGQRRLVDRVSEPKLSMKGRSPARLLAQMNAWHRDLQNNNVAQIPAWRSTGIAPFHFRTGRSENGTEKIWTIRELLSGKALFAEGRALRHCVASYARMCASGTTSIWTMEVAEGPKTAGSPGRDAGTLCLNKHLTIQVRPMDRTIVQIRGKHNRVRTPAEDAIIRRWCKAAGLKIAACV